LKLTNAVAARPVALMGRLTAVPIADPIGGNRAVILNWNLSRLTGIGE
jgi:CodY helix-turn-helix domain